MNAPSGLVTLCGYVVCLFVGILGFIIIGAILFGKIDISRLISEPNGDASMSRFQLLIFTFVVALSFFLVVESKKPTPELPEVPGSVLSLLGISASSYLVSKGIQFSSNAGIKRALVITPNTATVGFGQTQQFKATLGAGKDEADVTWAMHAGPGSISTAGLYTAPAAPPAGPAAGTLLHATIKATSVSDPDLTDLAVVNIT